MTRRRVIFDDCFDEYKVALLEELLPDTYASLNRLARWRRGRWPTRVHCLSDKRIIEGRRRGAGHGMTYVEGNDIWMSPYMTAYGYWLVFVHENIHHAYPDASEREINLVHMPQVHLEVFDEPMDFELAKRHGLGPPCPWGDRGFVGGKVPKVCR